MAKAFSWRLFGSIATGLIVFLFTGSFEISLGVGALDFIAKLALYYLHERVWDSIPWGRT